MELKPFLASLFRACEMTSSASVASMVESHLKADVKALVKLAENAAAAEGCKTVKVEHVLAAASRLPKPSGAQKGGRVSMASEYFGAESGRYGADASGGSTENVDFANGIARPELAQNVLTGGGKKKKLDGGRVAMPSEFFGVDSGRYGDAGAYASTENIDFANGIARAEVAMTTMSGGAKMPMFPKVAIKSAFTMRASKDAVDKIRELVMGHITMLMKDFRGRSKGVFELTEAKAERVFNFKRNRCREIFAVKK